MEVLDSQQTVLTNAEMYQLVLERRKSHSELSKDQRVKALGTVIYETSSYLQNTPAATQKVENIENLIRALAPFKLTAAETLQVINLRPSTAIELQLVVEECEERLTEDQMGQLVNIISENLPPRPSSAEQKTSAEDGNERMET
uniref:DNA-directed RNA polymerase III subunit RPC9 n=1 Tax=Parascaris univalens TaxID=6257 RepID=A0A915BD55_PARUN